MLNRKRPINYIAVDKRLKNYVTDAKVIRDMFDGSDHLTVLMKMELHERWRFRKQLREGKTRLIFEKLNI